MHNRSEEVINTFIQHQALLTGHFRFTSGKHGDRFLQFARILQYPKVTESLCNQLAGLFDDFSVDLVVGPATGGIVLAYEVAKRMGARFAFLEKDGDSMVMKRGFSLLPKSNVLIVEDVTTTGGSVKKCITHIQERGGIVVGVGCIVNRNPKEVQFSVPFRALAEIQFESWDPEQCPLCKEGTPLVEPDDILTR